MNSIETKTVRDLVVEVPGATRVFEKAGIDYCCGGQRSLADACASAGVTVEDMLNSLELVKSSPAPGEESNFLSASLAELIDHIVAKHHVFTKTELQRLRALIDKVHSVHGENHPELTQLRTLFQNLSSELEPHMLKEEMVLFPYIVRLETASRHQQSVSTPPFVTVANPVRMMMLEHEAAGYLLERIRKLTNDYTVPPDGCFSYKTLYEALTELEKDLHQHIHLENNILFPRAVQMEGQSVI